MPLIGISNYMLPGKALWSRNKERTLPESVHRVCFSSASDLQGVVMIARKNLPGLILVDLGSCESILQWNKQNSDQPVEAGSVIIKVNGITHPQKMLEEFGKAQAVDILINTQLSKEQQLAFQEALETFRQFADRQKAGKASQASRKSIAQPPRSGHRPRSPSDLAAILEEQATFCPE